MEKLTKGNLTPAYGRDYKSKRSLLEDFEKGKDFILNTPWQTTYCSIRDFAQGAKIQFRYKSLRETFIHILKEGIKEEEEVSRKESNIVINVNIPKAITKEKE